MFVLTLSVTVVLQRTKAASSVASKCAKREPPPSIRILTKIRQVQGDTVQHYGVLFGDSKAAERINNSVRSILALGIDSRDQP